MKVLVFDTETTGLPKYGAKLPNVNQFPYIVQFSWLVYDDATMKITNINNHIIRLPEGMEVPEESSKIHGISTEKMLESGEDIRMVMKNFHEAVVQSQILVAHNIKFDDQIVQCECIRHGIPNFLKEYTTKIKYCTMNYGKEITKIERPSKFKKGEMYFKPPKLLELHKHFFGTVPNNLHDSMVDVFVCFRCFNVMTYNKDLFDVNTQSELAKYYNDLTQISN